MDSISIINIYVVLQDLQVYMVYIQYSTCCGEEFRYLNVLRRNDIIYRI